MYHFPFFSNSTDALDSFINKSCLLKSSPGLFIETINIKQTPYRAARKKPYKHHLRLKCHRIIPQAWSLRRIDCTSKRCKCFVATAHRVYSANNTQMKHTKLCIVIIYETLRAVAALDPCSNTSPREIDEATAFFRFPVSVCLCVCVCRWRHRQLKERGNQNHRTTTAYTGPPTAMEQYTIASVDQQNTIRVRAPKTWSNIKKVASRHK